MLETGKDMNPPYKRLLNFATLWIHIFASFQHITLKLGKFNYFNMLFSLVSMDFR